MKKFVSIAFLIVGTVGFAGSSSAKSASKITSPTSCCSVGEFTSCVGDTQDCCRARTSYCGAHQCSKATLASL